MAKRNSADWGRLTAIEQLMRSLTLREYVRLFGTIWDPEQRTYGLFQAWKGQEDLMDWLEWRTGNSIHHRDEAYIPKARQLGISEITAERGVKTSLSFARSQGVIISKSERDAKYMLKNRVVPKLQNLRPYPGISHAYPSIVRLTDSTVELSNGSSITSLPPTESSGASMTLDWIAMDEMGGMDAQPHCDASILFKNALPAIEKSVRAGVGWFMGIGTSEPGSFFNDELKAQYEGRKSKKYFFLSWRTDPNRDEAWKRRETERLSCDADFRNQFPENMAEFFATREGAVFPTFDPTVGGPHVVENHPRWMDEGQYFVGYDHGFRHWAACLHAFYHPRKDHLHIATEQYWKGTEVHVMGSEINALIASYRKVPHVQLADIQIFNKDARKSVADHFRDAGVIFKPAYKADEAGSRSLLSERFTFKRVTIHFGCRNVIRQLSDYRWNPKTKGETPVDGEDEAPDIMRWFCAHLARQGAEKPVQPVPEASYGHREKVRRKYNSGRSLTYSSSGLPHPGPKGGGWQST